MKKTVCFLCVIAILCSVVGCATSNQAPAQENSQAPAESTAQTQAPADKAGESTESTPAPVSEGEFSAPPPTSKTAPIKVGWVPVVMNAHYSMVLAGVKEVIDKMGGEAAVELIVQSPQSNTSSINDQIDIVETLLEQDLDALCVSTESDDALKPLFKKAAEKGIPVFEFNMPTVALTNDWWVSNVGYDQREAGRLIGEWVVQHFADKPTKIGVLEGFPGVLNRERVEGFKEGIAGHDNLEIVFSQPADWQRAKGQSVTENMLEIHPDINFIFGLYDEMALGAVAAVKAAKKLDNIVIAGYDNTRDAYDSICAGELYVTVDTAAKDMGVNLMNAVREYVMEGKTVEKVINSKIAVYDRTNITDFDTNSYQYVPPKS